MNALNLPQLFASREAEVLNFFSKEENCDLTFVTGEEEAVLHTSQLAISAVSPVFKAMLSSEMKEGKLTSEVKEGEKKRKLIHIPDVKYERKVVRIPDVKHETLSCVVRYAHGIQFEINMDNCTDVRRVAEKYQIVSLIPFLDDYIVNVLTEENFCNVLGDVCLFQSSDLTQRCLEKMTKLDNKTLILSEGFTNLSLAQFKLLLDSDELRVDEETLWERCLIWAERLSAFDEQSEKKDLLKQVKNSIRFPVMKPDFIVKNVYPENVLEHSEYAMVLSAAVTPTFSNTAPFSTWPRIITKVIVDGAGIDFVNGEYIIEAENRNGARSFVKHNALGKNNALGSGQRSLTLSRISRDRRKTWSFFFTIKNGTGERETDFFFHCYASTHQNENTTDFEFPPTFGWETPTIDAELRDKGHRSTRSTINIEPYPTLIFR